MEGVLHPSSMDANRPMLALWDRAEGAAPRHPVFHRALADPALLTFLREACARFGYVLV
ncbi:MAG: hypothetical protein ACQEXJ_24360 [Myxococcota bacterium]